MYKLLMGFSMFSDLLISLTKSSQPGSKSMMNQVLLLSEVYEESRHQAKKKIETTLLLIDSMETSMH